MMTIINSLRINVRKLKARKSKALFLILPIAILVGSGITLSSQIRNIRNATDESIFGEIEEESTILQVTYQAEDRGFGFAGPGGQSFSISSMGDNMFNEADLETISSIDNVTATSINSALPISPIRASDLFNGITLNLRQISALGEEMASMYTSEEFTYEEGQPIPIILNASTFTETYEDWEGKDVWTIDFEQMRPEPGGEPPEAGTLSGPQQISPIKTRAVEYDKDDLIGKSFTITFGGFEDISTIETERSSGVITMTKRTDDEIAAILTSQKAAIGQYWNYDTLASGVTYTCIVAGVIEDQAAGSTYIPTEFADKVMEDYIQLQLNSIVAEVPTDLLDSTFTGSTYDGTELSQMRMLGFGRSFRGDGGGAGFVVMGGPPEEQDAETESYAIPGFVIETSEDGSGDIVGIYSDPTVYSQAVKTGDTIGVKIASIYDREQVIADLNENGYAYQDTSSLDIFYTVQSTLKNISSWLIVGFFIITSAVIMLTMSKFVSDSRKEIGIFRAVGCTKRDIAILFILQAILYTAVGYVAGAILGIGLNLAASQVVATWFDSFIANTVQKAFTLVNAVDHTQFLHLDWNSIGLLSGIMFTTALVVSCIPAYTASNVSPVEAIRNE